MTVTSRCFFKAEYSQPTGTAIVQRMAISSKGRTSEAFRYVLLHIYTCTCTIIILRVRVRQNGENRKCGRIPDPPPTLSAVILRTWTPAFMNIRGERPWQRSVRSRPRTSAEPIGVRRKRTNQYGCSSLFSNGRHRFGLRPLLRRVSGGKCRPRGVGDGDRAQGLNCASCVASRAPILP